MKQKRNFRMATARAVTALALAGLIGGLAAASARADDDWRRHERYEHHDRGRHRGWDKHHERVYVAPPPPVVYAPPPVVYAPPPPPAGINLIFPLNIR
jgi:hypothetical protein